MILMIGMFSSVWNGKLADRHGRQIILLLNLSLASCGVLLTLDPHLLSKIFGLGLFTFGFFGGHSIASSWVGQRALRNKAQASSLYLFLYYMGSSMGGTAGGMFWTSFGWGGLVTMIMGFLLLAFILLAYLSKMAVKSKQVAEYKI